MPQVVMSFHAIQKPLIRVCSPIPDPFCETVVIPQIKCQQLSFSFPAKFCNQPSLITNIKQ